LLYLKSGLKKKKIYLEKCKNKIPGFLEINGVLGSPSAGLWNWIAGGLELVTPELAKKELLETNWVSRAEDEFNKMYNPQPQHKSYIRYT
jgi:hypothetical protein